MTNNQLGITILVVDDEKNVRKAVAAEFEYEGYRVITAQNGQEALEILASSLVAVVISDILHPTNLQLLSAFPFAFGPSPECGFRNDPSSSRVVIMTEVTSRVMGMTLPPRRIWQLAESLPVT